MCSVCTIRSHTINFQPFLTSFAIFMHLLIFWAKMTLKLKNTTNEQCWKLAWYHHFTHIACAKKLRWLRQKLDSLCVQNEQSLSKCQGFGQKPICYKGISFFLNLFQLHTFCEFNMHHSKPHPQISTLSNFICYFSCL